MACSDKKELDPIILQAFEENGWCPRQVDYLRNTFNPPVLSYLSTLKRSKFRNASHATCQKRNHCSAYNVDSKTYEPAHTSKCSTTSATCNLVRVDTQTLIDTIRKGKVPLISIEVDDDDNVSLQISPRNDETQYIAISHVWSDGLGNPKGNALPSCQLKQLKLQAAKLKPFRNAPPSPLIWIDTLCIPLKPQHSCYRKQEIKRMSSIYAGAATILVLDSELQKINASAIREQELLARIICSVWMQRCWTLEEGIVSNLCFFQFQNNPIDPPVFSLESTGTLTPEESHVHNELKLHLWDRLHYGRATGLRHSIYCKEALQIRSCIRSQTPIRIVFLQFFSLKVASTYAKLARNDGVSPSYLAHQLVRTWNELAHRSTSRAEDIYAIMASVLGFSPERIMNLQDNAKRLQALIFSFPYLPVSLFFNTGPRHKQAEMHNNRWVPEEIGHYMLQEGGIMRLTDEGLHLNIQKRQDIHIYLVAGVLSDEISFHISTQPEAIYLVKLFHEVSSGNDALRSRYKSVCLLLQHPLSADTQYARGALFRIHTTEGDGGSPAESHADLNLIFDCPIDIYCTRPTLRKLDVKHATKAEHTTKVLVRYDKTPTFEVLPRRPISHMSLMFPPVVYFIEIVFLLFVLISKLRLFSVLPESAPARPGLLILFSLNMAVAKKEVTRFLESLAYRTWLELFDHDVPEDQRSLEWKLCWNIMDEEKYADIRWEQWGASWKVAKRAWTRFWDVIWNEVWSVVGSLLGEASHVHAVLIQ